MKDRQCCLVAPLSEVGSPGRPLRICELVPVLKHTKLDIFGNHETRIVSWLSKCIAHHEMCRLLRLSDGGKRVLLIF